jgi:hypothetical protein
MLGSALGARLGTEDGSPFCFFLDVLVGASVGTVLGAVDGFVLGRELGNLLGSELGRTVGDPEG